MNKTLLQIRERYPDALETAFGDSAALSEHLIALIRAGRKTATVGALQDYIDENAPIPKVGDHQIVLSFDGEPVLVLRTTDSFIRPFADIAWDFARHEGENENHRQWRAEHQAYFERNGGYDPNMPLVCERFQLVEDLNA